MFSCRDATNLMTDESEGALSGRGRFGYRTHMVLCAHCRAFRRQLREVVELAREIPREKDAPRPELEERLVEAFRAQKRG
jgi:hypothetical protein